MPTLQRDALRKLYQVTGNKLIALRIEYSELSKLLTGYVQPLVGLDRIHPSHLPTQSNHRWSTFRPPVTNWPRACINPDCVQQQHSWTDNCWSLRDIIIGEDDEYTLMWDHDNIEGRLGALQLQDEEDIQAFTYGYDLHTITCCKLFGYDLPQDLRNPHKSDCDRQWREKYLWQGKDTLQRVLSKNFNHGSRYAILPTFVHTIKNIEQFGLSYKELEGLAVEYMKVKATAFARKKEIMKQIQKDKVAYNFYGARRVFFDNSQHTAKEGFNFTISSTVALYNDMTLISLVKLFGKENITVLHNAHDGDKVGIAKHYVEAHYASKEEFIANIRPLIERDVTYKGNTLKLTAEIRMK